MMSARKESSTFNLKSESMRVFQIIRGRCGCGEAYLDEMDAGGLEEEQSARSSAEPSDFAVAVFDRLESFSVPTDLREVDFAHGFVKSASVDAQGEEFSGTATWAIGALCAGTASA